MISGTVSEDQWNLWAFGPHQTEKLSCLGHQRPYRIRRQFVELQTDRQGSKDWSRYAKWKVKSEKRGERSENLQSSDNPSLPRALQFSCPWIPSWYIYEIYEYRTQTFASLLTRIQGQKMKNWVKEHSSEGSWHRVVTQPSFGRFGWKESQKSIQVSRDSWIVNIHKGWALPGSSIILSRETLLCILISKTFMVLR